MYIVSARNPAFKMILNKMMDILQKTAAALEMVPQEVNEHLTVCSCHVTYAFQSESTLYSCLNVKELLARSRHKI